MIKILNYLLNIIYAIAVRTKFIKSPSFNVFGQDPKNYRARISSTGVAWVMKSND